MTSFAFLDNVINTSERLLRFGMSTPMLTLDEQDCVRNKMNTTLLQNRPHFSSKRLCSEEKPWSHCIGLLFSYIYKLLLNVRCSHLSEQPCSVQWGTSVPRVSTVACQRDVKVRMRYHYVTSVTSVVTNHLGSMQMNRIRSQSIWPASVNVKGIL